MSEYKQFIYVVLTLITFVFMFRWELEVGGGEGISHKLDRWTGSSYVCLGLNGCTKQED
jgi:hypothetical protein